MLTFISKRKFLVLVLTGCFLTTDICCKRGGTGSSSGSRGGVFTSIKNAITGQRGGGIQRPGGHTGGSGVGLGTGRRPPSQGIFGNQRRQQTGRRPAWSSSAGRSSWASSRNKAILAGTLGTLAGAYVGYKVGQAMHRPWYTHNGQQYWYGNRYYQPTVGRKTCVFEVDDSTPNFDVRYEDNSKVREIVFECHSYENCCEMSCCRTPHQQQRGSAYSYHNQGWRWWYTMIISITMALSLERLLDHSRDYGWWDLTHASVAFILSVLLNFSKKLTLMIVGMIIVLCAVAVGRLYRNRDDRQTVVFSPYDESASKPLNSYPAYPVQQPYAYQPAPTYTAPPVYQ